MKQIITLLFLLSTSALTAQAEDQQEINSQELPCFVEITIDTLTAYKEHLGGWEQEGLFFRQQVEKDSIGTRVEKVYKMYFRDTTGDKKYLPYNYREYISGIRDILL